MLLIFKIKNFKQKNKTYSNTYKHVQIQRAKTCRTVKNIIFNIIIKKIRHNIIYINFPT